jgi:hypothetical protein
MLTLRQIEVIRAIMVTGTVADAARLLNVSGECRPCGIQGGYHTITDCPTVRNFPIECAESVGVG